MRREISFVIIILLIFVLSTIAEAIVPLTVEVKCGDGKCTRNNIPGGYAFYADADDNIILTSYAKDGIGSKSHIWTKDGKIILKSKSLQITVIEEEKYLLTVTDDGGSIDTIVKIFPRSKEPCILSLSNIKLNDKVKARRETREYAVGDIFSLTIPYTKTGDCEIEIKWETDDSGIIFKSPSSKATKVGIGSQAKTGKHIVKVTILGSDRPKEKEINISVVRNSPPFFELDFDYPESYSVFKVNFKEIKTGSTGNENNDFIQNYYVELEDNNSVVDKVSWNRRSYKEDIPTIKLKTKGIGLHNLTVTITDSHGKTSTITEEIVVLEGDNKQTPLVMNSLPDRIDCVVGEECEINAWEVFNRYERKASIKFYDKTKQKTFLTNSKGGYCSGSPICKHVFGYQGIYKVKVVANYNDRKGSKNIIIVVTDNETILDSTPTSVPISVTTSIPTPYPYRTSASSAKTPGMEFGIAIVVLITAFVFQKRKK
ncbi:hypothetical protein KAT63_01045 [Candidatus Parcubacteria bacterium]|nr:hypothetical protein [Candidatus Parcubacteria bacterium]